MSPHNDPQTRGRRVGGLSTLDNGALARINSGILAFRNQLELSGVDSDLDQARHDAQRLRQSAGSVICAVDSLMEIIEDKSRRIDKKVNSPSSTTIMTSDIVSETTANHLAKCDTQCDEQIKSGLEHLESKAVPTGHGLAEDFPRPQEFGYFSVFPEEDIMCDTTPVDTSGLHPREIGKHQLSINIVRELQTQDNGLHGQSYAVLMNKESNPSAEFQIPDLSNWSLETSDGGHHELFRSPVWDETSKAWGSPCLTGPVSPSTSWRGEVGRYDFLSSPTPSDGVATTDNHQRLPVSLAKPSYSSPGTSDLSTVADSRNGLEREALPSQYDSVSASSANSFAVRLGCQQQTTTLGVIGVPDIGNPLALIAGEECLRAEGSLLNTISADSANCGLDIDPSLNQRSIRFIDEDTKAVSRQVENIFQTEPRDGNSTAGLGWSDSAPIEIDSSSESETASSLFASSLEEPKPIPGTANHWAQLIKDADAAFKFPVGTLRRFMPRRFLSDVNIVATLEMLLPPTVEPLIAEHAIENFPCRGLAVVWTPTEESKPSLRHNEDSTHLFVAYNVPYGSLNCTKQDSKNHWVLLIVDILEAKIYIFGAERGLEEQAKVLARNIGTFVNNHRSRLEDYYPPIYWSDPVLQPLYQIGNPPDDYNCGIAVIYRSVTFIHPNRKLQVSASTTPSELTGYFNKLRAQILNLFLNRYKVFRTKEHLYAQIISPASLSKKRPATDRASGGRDSKAAKIPNCRFYVRSTPQVAVEIELPLFQCWKVCILSCAEAKGFDAQPILEAFKQAPNMPIEHVLRVLQLMCEVASPDLAIKLKKTLNRESINLVQETASMGPPGVEDLIHLHFLLEGFEAEPYMLTFKSLFCLVSYSETFEDAVSSLAKHLRSERLRKKRIQYHASKSGKTPEAQGENKSIYTANQQIRESLVKSLQMRNISHDEAHGQVKRHLKDGKTLRMLLNGRNPLWLLLTTLQADENDSLLETASPPALNLMDYGPPTRSKKLEQPISRREYGVDSILMSFVADKYRLLDLNETLAKYFGSYLFNARPELRNLPIETIDPFNGMGNMSSICSKSDENIRRTAPKDVAELFKPVIVSSQSFLA